MHYHAKCLLNELRMLMGDLLLLLLLLVFLAFRLVCHSYHYLLHLDLHLLVGCSVRLPVFPRSYDKKRKTRKLCEPFGIMDGWMVLGVSETLINYIGTLIN